MKQLHGFVSGFVQGVFFRANTKQWAKQLGLTGWVKNLDDGRVEFFAEGSKEKLQAFLQKLKLGSMHANVQDVEIEWKEVEKQEFDDFRVVY